MLPEFNLSAPYAAYSPSHNRVHICSTTNWNCIGKIVFDDSEASVAAIKFSSCGQVCIVRSIINAKIDGYIKIYDMQQKKTILEDSYIAGGVQCYKNNLIIYKRGPRELAIYDYIQNEKVIVTTAQPITLFALEGDLLALSSGRQTELYNLGDVIKDREKYYAFDEHYDIDFIFNYKAPRFFL